MSHCNLIVNYLVCDGMLPGPRKPCWQKPCWQICACAPHGCTSVQVHGLHHYESAIDKR